MKTFGMGLWNIHTAFNLPPDMPGTRASSSAKNWPSSNL